MSWWDSFDTLSKVQTALAILVSVLGFATLTVKLRADHIKKRADARRLEERILVDKELKDKTAEALRATTSLEAKQAPRSLTDAQRTDLTRLLSNGPKGQLFVVPKTFDEEAEAFAKQISDVLVASGFTLSSLPPPRPMSLGRSGAFLWVHDMAKPPPHAAFIQDCFKQIGITLDGYGGAPMIDDNGIIIAISQKP